MWDHQAVSKLLSEEGLSSEYWKLVARAWLKEMAGGGIIESVEESINQGSYFGKDKVEYRYRITPLGKARVQTMLEG